MSQLISKYLDPKNDVAFRKIFGSEKNKNILIHFLNDMLVFRESKPIKNISFLKTIQDPVIASKKESIVDVLCEDEDANQYIVEMQISEHAGFEKRAQYYAAKAYINNIEKGEKRYSKLKEVIFLAIADFVMFPDKAHYKSDHVMLDRETYEHDLKDFSFTFLELPKFTKGKHELKTMTEKWAYYFKHAKETSEDEMEEIFKNDLVIKQAYEELNRFHWTEEELRTYDQEIKRYLDNQAVLLAAEQKGEARGVEKGENKKTLEIAQKMLAKNLSVELIAETTGLSSSEINQLATAKDNPMKAKQHAP